MAPKIANLSDFIDQFKEDLARPCNYTVTINQPYKWDDFGKQFTGKTSDFNIQTKEIRRRLEFACEAAELPGRAFAIVDQKTYGPIEQYPIQNAYNKMNLSIMCSSDMSEKKFFDYWMELICRSNITNQYASAYNINSNAVTFDFEYKSNYVCDVFIDQRDLMTNVVYRSILSDAFPVECHAMPLSWKATDDYHRVNVTLAYRYAYQDTNI